MGRLQKEKFHIFLIFILVSTAAIYLQFFGSVPIAEGKLLVFPGAEGFGTDTPAGRGGQIIRVTNLNASGDGSLKAAIDATGPRVVVFEVSGTIRITSELKIRNPFVTIAGQTAPSPGITVRGAALVVKTHDVLLQHLRIRVGDLPDGPAYENRDALKIEDPEQEGDVYNVVIDHCSLSWSTDEILSMWYNTTRNITVSNCIISEPLNRTAHPKCENGVGHGYAIVIGPGVKSVSFLRNLVAHSVQRNPLFVEGTETVIINNIIYNWGEIAITPTGHLTKGDNHMSSIIGNYFLPGPNSSTNMILVTKFNDSPGTSKVFIEDNYLFGAGIPKDQWTNLVKLNSGSIKANIISDFSPLNLAGITLWPGSDVLDKLFNSADLGGSNSTVGARPADRDSVDARIVRDVRDGTGSIIDSQDEVGSWPNLEERHRSLSPPANPYDDDDGDGYTNLEEWLHGFSREVEGFGSGIGVPKKLNIKN